MAPNYCPVRNIPFTQYWKQTKITTEYFSPYYSHNFLRKPFIADLTLLCGCYSLFLFAAPNSCPVRNGNYFAIHNINLTSDRKKVF